MQMSPSEDLRLEIDLLCRIKRKDLLAYRELIDRYYSFVYMIAYTLHRDDRMADQYVLDLFSYVWNHAEGLSFRGTFRQYLFKLIYAKYQRQVSAFPSIKDVV
jgi:DNA-directed RNA polymerase specialized sigma24 family protein